MTEKERLARFDAIAKEYEAKAEAIKNDETLDIGTRYSALALCKADYEEAKGLLMLEILREQEKASEKVAEAVARKAIDAMMWQIRQAETRFESAKAHAEIGSVIYARAEGRLDGLEYAIERLASELGATDYLFDTYGDN
jgi:hypothetical protein